MRDLYRNFNGPYRDTDIKTTSVQVTRGELELDSKTIDTNQYNHVNTT